MEYTIYLFVLCSFQVSLSDVNTPHLCWQVSDDGNLMKCFTAITGERPMNWNDAEKYCENLVTNGHLASIHNAFDQSRINAWLPFFTTDPWVGAFHIGGLPYQWSDGTAWDYSNWYQGQPTKNCGKVCHSDSQCRQGKWTTADCENDTAQLICEYGNFSITTPPPTVVEGSRNPISGKYLALVVATMTWTNADRFCRNRQQNGTVATLASISGSYDQDLIGTLLQHPALNGNVFIGGFKFGAQPFAWTDETPFSYTNWAPGQPPLDAEGCVQICQKTDLPSNCVQGQWTVVPCSTQQSFLCENLPYPAADCLQLHQQHAELPSSIYFLTPPNIAQGFDAYCNMETDGGGWTVFQRRIDRHFSFNDKTWEEYKSGFGNGLDDTFWLGNDYIHILSTKDPKVEMRIDIYGDRAPNSPYPTGFWYGIYTSFMVDTENNFYTLRIDNTTSGNASDGSSVGINANNGMKFSTNDGNRNHDGCGGCCIGHDLGGWWLGNCGATGVISLNGLYEPQDWHSSSGYVWYTGNYSINPSQSRMMLRKVP